MTAALAAVPASGTLLGQLPGRQAGEGNAWAEEPGGPILMAAGTTRKAAGRAKGSTSREASARSRNTDVGEQYAALDLDSLLLALRPMKDLKMGRMNARNLRTGATSSHKGKGKRGDGSLWFKLGLSYSAKNEYDNAIAAFTAAIAADHRDGSSYYNRAVVRQKCGQYEAAIDDYTRAVGPAPNDPDIYYNRALRISVPREREGSYLRLRKGYSKESERCRRLLEPGPCLLTSRQGGPGIHRLLQLQGPGTG